MFEQRLGKIVRINDPDVIKSLKSVTAIDLEGVSGAVIARAGTRIQLLWTKNGVPGFRRPRQLDDRAGEMARVWLSKFNRRQGELFRIEVPDVFVEPRFTTTRLVIPFAFARDDTLKVTFSCNTADEFASGNLRCFLTKERYPMSFGLRAGANSLTSNPLRYLSTRIKPLRLINYKFINQNGEDYYFRQDLPAIR